MNIKLLPVFAVIVFLCIASASQATDLTKDQIQQLVAAEGKVGYDLVQLHNINPTSMLPSNHGRIIVVGNWQDDEKIFSTLCEADGVCVPSSPEQNDEAVLVEEIGDILIYLENPDNSPSKIAQFKTNLGKIAANYIKLSKDLMSDYPVLGDILKPDLQSNAGLLWSFVEH